MSRYYFRLAIIPLIFLVFISACASPQARPPTQAPATPVQSSPVPTKIPSSTPTPQPRALLFASPQADPAQLLALESVLSGLARQDGLAFQTVQSLAPSDLASDVRLVVALPPDPGLANLAAAAPGVQFLAVGIPELESKSNLSVIGVSGGRPDQQGFLAGYLASVLTPDWRVGVISHGDTGQGKAARQGFINGAIFFCGLCRPAYPPFVQYPVTADLSAGAGQADQQAAADALIAQGVQTVYVFPDAGDQFLLEYLAQAGVNIIGGITPPDNLSKRWIATIQADWSLAVEQAWDKLIKGEPYPSQVNTLALTDRNEALFSEGRQRLVDQTLAELSSGLIDTGVDPVTGENR